MSSTQTKLMGWACFNHQGMADVQFVRGSDPRSYYPKMAAFWIPLTYDPAYAGQQPIAYVVAPFGHPELFAKREAFSDRQGGTFDVNWLDAPVYLDLPPWPLDDWGRWINRTEIDTRSPA